MTEPKNDLALEILKTRTARKLTIKQVSNIYSITPREAKELCDKANEIIKYGDISWLEGLSNRARRLLLSSEYKDFPSLRKALRDDVVDLEDIPRIGHKVAMEITTWCAEKEKKM